MEITLDGWDIGHGDDKDWAPWGSRGDARAKMIASGDGYLLMLVEADPGYKGDPHEHEFTEFNFVLDGTLVNQGVPMKAGDGYVAAAGSTHADFVTDEGARYLVIFKI